MSGPVPADALTGTYGNALKLSNSGNVFAGDGALLANVNASTLGGFGSCNLPCYWNLLGNSGTDPAVNFLGTKGNTALTIGVSNLPALRLFPDQTTPTVTEPVRTSPNIARGYAGNFIHPATRGATIAGGGALIDPVFGGSDPGMNSVGAFSDFSFLGSGIANYISGNRNAIVGGHYNRMTNGVLRLSTAHSNRL